MSLTIFHKLATFQRAADHAGHRAATIQTPRLGLHWEAYHRAALQAVASYQAEAERIAETLEAIMGQPGECAPVEMDTVEMGQLRPAQKNAVVLAMINFPDDPYHNAIVDCAHQIVAAYPWTGIDSPDKWVYQTSYSSGASLWACKATGKTLVVKPGQGGIR
jgi:hypothetical protein